MLCSKKPPSRGGDDDGPFVLESLFIRRFPMMIFFSNRKTKRTRSRATNFSLLFEKKTLHNKRTNDKATSKNGPLGTFFSPTTTISLSKPDDFIGEEEEEEERISKTLERILRGREDPETTTRWVCEYNNRRHDGC